MGGVVELQPGGREEVGPHKGGGLTVTRSARREVPELMNWLQYASVPATLSKDQGDVSLMISEARRCVWWLVLAPVCSGSKLGIRVVTST